MLEHRRLELLVRPSLQQTFGFVTIGTVLLNSLIGHLTNDDISEQQEQLQFLQSLTAQHQILQMFHVY